MHVLGPFSSDDCNSKGVYSLILDGGTFDVKSGGIVMITAANTDSPNVPGSDASCCSQVQARILSEELVETVSESQVYIVFFFFVSKKFTPLITCLSYCLFHAYYQSLPLPAILQEVGGILCCLVVAFREYRIGVMHSLLTVHHSLTNKIHRNCNWRTIWCRR